MNLAQSVVAGSSGTKCALKYVMQSFGRPSQMNRKEKGRAVADPALAFLAVLAFRLDSLRYTRETLLNPR